MRESEKRQHEPPPRDVLRAVQDAAGEVLRAKGRQARRNAGRAMDALVRRSSLPIGAVCSCIKTAMEQWPKIHTAMACGWVMGAERGSMEFGARSCVGESLCDALDYLEDRSAAGALATRGRPKNGARQRGGEKGERDRAAEAAARQLEKDTAALLAAIDGKVIAAEPAE